MARWIAAIMLGVLLAGCGESPVPSSWVATDGEAAVYIRWVRDGNALSGQLRVARLDGLEVVNEEVPFSDSVSGSDVVLQLERLLGLTQTITGTVGRDELALSFPQEDGTLEDVVLVAGDVSGFNEGVRELQTEAATNREIQAEIEEVEAAEREREAQQEAAQTKTASRA